MVKQKGGLGRGLNSLLGVETDNALPQETSAPAERITVDTSTSNDESSNRVKAPDAPKAEKENADEVYSNKEDNITIKSVVERPIPQRPSQKPAPIEDDKSETESQTTDEVPLESIEPNPDQPRTNFKKEDLEELSESIKKNGLLQPILVRKVGDKYQIIAGERRWQACKLAGLKKAPIRIKEVDDDEAIVLALIENIQRSDLNPIEEAYGYRRMMERGKMSHTQVAQAVSKGRSTITNALRLLELPEDAQQLLFEEKITAGHARAILSVPPESRSKLTDKIVNEKLSVRETEAIARLLSGKKNTKTTERPKVPKSYKTVARSLCETLKTDVHVKSSKGKNKIEILFKDEADLERLFRMIASE